MNVEYKNIGKSGFKLKEYLKRFKYKEFIF
jgi:hypothetical protein